MKTVTAYKSQFVAKYFHKFSIAAVANAHEFSIFKQYNGSLRGSVVKKHLGGLQGTQVQSLVGEVPPAVRCGQRRRERKK